MTNNYGSVTSSIVQIKSSSRYHHATHVNQYGEYQRGTYNAVASGFPPLGYQWYFNTSSNYSGATEASGSGYSGSTTGSLLATTNLQDYYFFIVTNNYGSVTSSITAYNPFPIIVAQASSSIVGTTINLARDSQWLANSGLSMVFQHDSRLRRCERSLTDGGGVSGSSTTNVAAATSV